MSTCGPKPTYFRPRVIDVAAPPMPPDWQGAVILYRVLKAWARLPWESPVDDRIAEAMRLFVTMANGVNVA